MGEKLLPVEVILNILYHLDGDRGTLHSLARTCRFFRALLLENQPRIAYTIADKNPPGPIRFLLEKTASTRRPPSFEWLHRGFARGHAVELLTNALENAGLYNDESVFGTEFSRYGRPLIRADHACVRRYVMTMLLAVELCSMRGRTRRDRLVWIDAGPSWAAGFILLSRDLVRYLVKMLHLCIRDDNTVRWGTTEIHAAWLFSERNVEYLTEFLHYGMLLAGARGMVDILSTTYDTYHQFEAVARYRLYADFMKPEVLEQAWPNGPILERWEILDRIKRRSSEDWRKAVHEERAGNGCKDYIVNNDIDEWKKDVPNEEAWAYFMHKHDWCRSLQFEPTMLRKVDIQPEYGAKIGRSGGAAWGVNEYLQDPVLAQ